MIEKSINDIILTKERFLEILNKGYKFKNKEEYANLCFLAEPNKIFQNKWVACITIPEKEIIEALIEKSI